MTNEFKDGLAIMLDIMAKKKTWKHLFEEVNFFSRYKHYICLLCATETEEDHLVFGSLVESKIRHLISFFEKNQCVTLCHINPKKFKPLPTFELSVNYENPTVTVWFVGLELNKQMRKNIDLTHEIQQFSDLVLKAASATGAYKPTMIVRPFYVRGKDVKTVIPEIEVTRGIKYIPKKSAVSNQQVNQKEIRGDKANSLTTTSSQPNSPARLENNSMNTSGVHSPLVHSTSIPNMDACAMADEPPAPQLPVEHPVLSNPDGLMNPNLERVKAEELNLKRNPVFDNATESPDNTQIPGNPVNGIHNPPPIKKARFDFLNSPQNGTVL